MSNIINVYTTRFTKDRIISLVKVSSHICDNAISGSVDNAKKVAAIIERIFDASNLPEEHLWLIAIDSGRKVSGLFEVSHGTLLGSYAHPREIFMRAVLAGAAAIILVHNHPSGLLDISENDKGLTNRIILAGEIMGIKLEDHIICGGGRFVSALK